MGKRKPKQKSLTVRQSIARISVSLFQVFTLAKNNIRKKRVRVISILFLLFLIAGYLILWVLSPNSNTVQAPVIVSSCDCDTLPHLSVKILDKSKLRIEAVFEKCNLNEWSDIRVQAPDDADDVNVEVEDARLADTEGQFLASRVKGLKDSLRSGFYFMLDSDFLMRHFDSIGNSRITLSYVTSQGIYKKSYSKYFLSLLFIPVNTKKRELNYQVPIDVLAPQSFLLTSSIPEAYKIFLLEDGINYTVAVIPERTGILLNFDDLELEASREIIILLASTILGFIIGVALEKALINDD